MIRNEFEELYMISEWFLNKNEPREMLLRFVPHVSYGEPQHAQLSAFLLLISIISRPLSQSVRQMHNRVLLGKSCMIRILGKIWKMKKAEFARNFLWNFLELLDFEVVNLREKRCTCMIRAFEREEKRFKSVHFFVYELSKKGSKVPKYGQKFQNISQKFQNMSVFGRFGTFLSNSYTAKCAENPCKQRDFLLFLGTYSYYLTYCRTTVEIKKRVIS